MLIKTTFPITVQTARSRLTIYPTVDKLLALGEIRATIVTQPQEGNPNVPTADRLIYALLDALEDCYPNIVQDWAWGRGQEMGLVNPAARP